MVTTRALMMTAAAVVGGAVVVAAPLAADERSDGTDESERADADGWLATLPLALDRAAERERPILIYYRRVADEACREMDDVIAEPAIARALDGFVRLKIDVDVQPEETERAVAHTGRPLQAAPQLQVLRADGSYLDGIAGYLPERTFALWLERVRGLLDPESLRVRGVWVLTDEPWLPTLRQALEVAGEEERPVLVYFRRLAEEGSRDLDGRTLSEPAVKRLLDRFVLVKVDVDLQPEERRSIEERVGVAIDATPELWVLRADGTMTERLSGFVPPTAMQAFLERNLRAAGDVRAPAADTRALPAPPGAARPSRD